MRKRQVFEGDVHVCFCVCVSGGLCGADQGGFSACQAPFVSLRSKEGSSAAVTTLPTWVLQKDAQMFKNAAVHASHLRPS